MKSTYCSLVQFELLNIYTPITYVQCLSVCVLFLTEFSHPHPLLISPTGGIPHTLSKLPRSSFACWWPTVCSSAWSLRSILPLGFHGPRQIAYLMVRANYIRLFVLNTEHKSFAMCEILARHDRTLSSNQKTHQAQRPYLTRRVLSGKSFTAASGAHGHFQASSRGKFE